MRVESMKSHTQLKLRGVRPEAIETAREAARRSGLSLSQWIDTAIERAAAVGSAARPSHAPAAGAGGAKYRDRLGDIAARLDRLAQREHGPPAADLHADVEDGDQAQRLTDVIGRLDQRLDRMVADNRARDARPREPARPASAAPSFSLDDAIAEIAARQHALDAEADGLAAEAPAPAVDLSGVEHLLHNITDQIGTLRRPCPVEDSLADLRHELAEIGRVVTEATPQTSLDAMQSELRSLSERIDRGAARGADDRTLTAIERGLNEVRDALNARPTAPSPAGFDHIATTGPDGESLGHLETAIAELRNVSARVASGDALAAVATDVRTIGAKLDRVAAPASDPDGMDHLLRRIDALAVALEARPAANEPPEGTEIEAQLKRLTDKLEMVETAAERRGFDQLEGQIAQLARKLDATDARLGNLGTIEHAIADLMERLHDTRVSALDAAEQAARAAVREMMVAPGRAGPEVDALKHDLTEFRAAQADIDRRTQDMLETLQGTLERLVDRLSAVETGVHARATVAGELAPDAASIPPPAAPLGRAMLPAVRPVAERRPINPGLPADLPLEPGTGAPRGRPATPAERIAASEALLPAAKPAVEPAGKANFIAAARRAAQAAAADASAEGTRSPETRTRGSGLGSIGSVISKRRRPLMIGLGILLLVLGTVQLVSSMLGSGEPRSAPSQASTPRGSAPPAATPQQAAPAAPADVAPASPPAAEPKPDGETKNLPLDPTGGTAAAPRATGQGAPLDGMAPVIPPFPTVPGSADATGSTGRAPTTVNVAPAAPTAAEPPPAPDKEPPAIPSPGLRNAALAGNPAAEYELAVRYAEGRGVPANVQDAVHWFELAANHGIAPAQYRLGSLYEKGQGVKKDLEAARRLYIAAANKGNGKAMHNLAVLYAEGLNGDPDYRTASQWFRKAAEHGIADSQYNLGILYARGIGVEQNLAESYKWFALAAQQGDKDAVKKRDDVAARLDQQSLVAARLAVQTWTADPQPEDAVDVKVPPGGWEKPAAPRPAKVKPAVGAPRKLTPT
jgi:localization factor PodJL